MSRCVGRLPEMISVPALVLFALHLYASGLGAAENEDVRGSRFFQFIESSPVIRDVRFKVVHHDRDGKTFIHRGAYDPMTDAYRLEYLPPPEGQGATDPYEIEGRYKDTAWHTQGSKVNVRPRDEANHLGPCNETVLSENVLVRVAHLGLVNFDPATLEWDSGYFLSGPRTRCIEPFKQAIEKNPDRVLEVTPSNFRPVLKKRLSDPPAIIGRVTETNENGDPLRIELVDFTLGSKQTVEYEYSSSGEGLGEGLPSGLRSRRYNKPKGHEHFDNLLSDEAYEVSEAAIQQEAMDSDEFVPKELFPNKTIFRRKDDRTLIKEEDGRREVMELVEAEGSGDRPNGRSDYFGWALTSVLMALLLIGPCYLAWQKYRGEKG